VGARELRIKGPGSGLGSQGRSACARRRRILPAPAEVEPAVVHDDATLVPVSVPDAQVAVGVAEKVGPGEEVEGVALRVHLPILRPELRVLLEEVEEPGRDVPAAGLELLAELVALDTLVAELVWRPIQLGLAAVQVEAVRPLLDLEVTAQAGMRHVRGSREGEGWEFVEVELVGSIDEQGVHPRESRA